MRWRQQKVLLAAITTSACVDAAYAAPFYVGGDVSLLTFDQQQGVVFKDNGVAANGDQILYDAGANLFRLRLFVNPQAAYTNTNYGAIQSRSYDIALAQQIKDDDPGAEFLLDFHYSDTWADPTHQTTPAAWSGESLTAMESTVQNYTQSALLAFKSAGVMPDMVQVGNETTNGMLWPDGQILYSGTTQQQNQSWANFGGLLNSAIAGVRAVQVPGQHIPIALSIDRGDSGGLPQWFYNNIQTLGGVSDYDIEGVDFYPSSSAGLSTMQSNLDALAGPYPTKKIMVLETNYPMEGTAPTAEWPATPAGQKQEFLDVRNMVMGLPDGLGEGALYWYPEGIQVPNYNIVGGGGPAVFDSSGNTLAAALPNGAFNVTGLTPATWIKNQDAEWNTATNWLGSVVPNAAGAEADLLSAISAAHTLTGNLSITLGTLYFNNLSGYTLGGTGSLTMSVASGSALISVLSGAHTIKLPLTIASNTTFTVASGASLAITGPVTVNPGITLNSSGTVNYSSGITVQNNAAITFETSFHATSLSLTTGVVAAFAGHGTNSTTLLQLDALNFSGSLNAWQGKLDLADNDMVVRNGSLINITSQLKQGSSGNWEGVNGIASSSAASSHLTALGVILNGTTYGTAADSLGLFDGIYPAPGDILVKYTWYGDANLDGRVDGSDYSLIDNGYHSHLTGWHSGDFNYDGAVDGSDYTLIDNAFNAQSGQPGTAAIFVNETAIAINSQNSVPEPANMLTLIFAVVSLCRRTRRRQSAL